MAYLGNDLQVAFPVYRNIDDISSSFNSSTTSFSLTVSGVAPVPAPLYSQQCLISVGGVVQRPDDSGTEGFRLSGSNIIFASAPATGADFFGVILAGADYVNAGANFPSGTASVPSITFDSDLDTGIYNSGANQVSVTTGGTERLRIDSAGQIEAVSLGTAAAPVFSFTTDPNTGIYSPGADQLAISTNGTGRLFVNASGKVGIGEQSPAELFEARDGNIALDSSGASVGARTTERFYKRTDNGSSNGMAAIGMKGAGTNGFLGEINFYTGLSDVFNTSLQSRMVITSDGKVGLGTSSPSATLHVAGAGLFRSSTTGTAAPLPSETTALSVISGAGYNATPSVAVHFGAQNGDVVDANKTFQWRFTAPSSSSSGTGLAISTVAWDWASTYTTTERIRIDPTGRVGVGTASPGYKLDISPDSTGAALRVRGGSGGLADVQFTDNSASTQWGTLSVTSSSADLTHSSTVRFSTASSERARIDSSGRLLVGTSSARQVGTERGFQVEAAGAAGSASIVRNDNGSASTAPVVVLGRSRGTSNGSNTIVQADDDLGYVIFAGADGSTLNSYGAWIRAQVDGTPGANDMPGRLVFSTTADGASSPTERMRIAQNGVITIQNGAVAVIGTLTDGATITPDFAADCNFTVTLGGNRTLANPTNITAGQSGSIFIVQDATGSRTLSWGSYWDFPGGTAPTLSTAANAVDRVDYIVRSSTSIHTVFTANYS